EFIALARGLLKHPAEIISWRRLTATPGLDASAIHGRLGAQVALLQSHILPAAGSLYPVKEIFCNVPVDKPHTRVSRFDFPVHGSGLLAARPGRRPFSIFASNLPVFKILRIATNSPSIYYDFNIFA
ncbi:MAG: hypothetical protein NTW03_07725, partial [Verrucomicrobia bacterium]|nr:hypothetical protein [Verrucomicrobiota bacterium]